MPTVEERLAKLEGRVHEHSQMFSLFRDALTTLERRLETFEARLDTRFEAIGQRLEALDDKMSNRLGWVIALFITCTVAIIAAILTRP